jgi:hypothetical protein
MKHSHRRLILRDVATLFAIPLALRQNGILRALDAASEPVADNGKPLGVVGSGLVRPRIAPPKGSVMRRG